MRLQLPRPNDYVERGAFRWLGCVACPETPHRFCVSRGPKRPTGGESLQSGGIRLLAEQQQRRSIINDLINTCAECRSLENSSTLTNTEPKPQRPLPLNTSPDSRDTREKPGFYARLFLSLPYPGDR